MRVVRERNAYASQSPVTDPGDLANRLDAVSEDLAALQRAAC